MQKVKKIMTAVMLMTFFICVATITVNASYVQAEAAVKAPTITSQKKTLYVGDKAYKIEFKYLSDKASVSYQSANPDVVKVTSKGKVQPVSPGTSDILTTVRQNNKTYHLKISIHVRAKAGGKTAKSILTVENKKLTAEEIYKKCLPATVEINSTNDDYQGLGSGFFIDDGVIVTNYHVIKGANKITVTTNNKDEYDVTQILGYDEKLDLAIIKINSSNDNNLIICKTAVNVGDDVYTIGSPLGLTGTMTKGMVSAASRKIDGVDYIQMDASISKGNSGGPLVNAYGEVVGINTMYYKYGNDLNFAINVNEIKKISTKNPLSVSDYYSKYEKQSEEEFLATMIHEDDVLSQNTSTCQYIPDDVGVEGTVTPTDDGDIYYFTMEDSGWFIINASLDNSEDTKNLDISIYDENYYLKSSASQDTATNTEYLARYLTPGTYYIYLYRDDDTTQNNIKYMFTTTKAYDSDN